MKNRGRQNIAKYVENKITDKTFSYISIALLLIFEQHEENCMPLTLNGSIQNCFIAFFPSCLLSLLPLLLPACLPGGISVCLPACLPSYLTACLPS
jgi:hypothetical protein